MFVRFPLFLKEFGEEFPLNQKDLLPITQNPHLFPLRLLIYLEIPVNNHELDRDYDIENFQDGDHLHEEIDTLAFEPTKIKDVNLF
jgi:hypothetical protein